MSVHSVHLSASHTFTKSPQPSITLQANHGVCGDIHAGSTVRHLYNLHQHTKQVAKAQIRDKNATLPVPANMKQVHLMPSELFAEVGFKGTGVEAGGLGENITTTGIDLVKLGKGTRLIFIADTETQASIIEAAKPIIPQQAHIKTLATSDKHARAILRLMILGCIFVLLIRHFPFATLALLTFALAQIDMPFRSEGSDTASADPEMSSAPSIILTGLRNPCNKINDFRPGLLAHCYVKDEAGKVVGAKVGVMGVVERGGVVRPGMRIVVQEKGVWERMERI